MLLPTQGAEQAQAVARDMLRVLEAPLALNGQTVDLNGSIGIAGFPEDGTQAPALMARADIAMYVAKQGRSGYACFTPDMERSAEHNRLHSADHGLGRAPCGAATRSVAGAGSGGVAERQRVGARPHATGPAGPAAR